MTEEDAPIRPSLGRHDTDALLSYYLKDPKELRRELSSSSSSSEYSTDSSEYSKASSSSPPVLRQRPSILSEGGSDRRRLAIVQIEKESSLRSRRGVQNSIALVAPPDASPKSYTSVTPPPTAPVSGSMVATDELPCEERGHHRSASEASAKKSTSPRNVGIVGSRPLAPLILESVTSPDHTHPLTTGDLTSLRPPIFIHPQSRSPSPAALSATDGDGFPLFKQHKVVTPNLGEGKPIDVPVAPPVVVPLTEQPPAKYLDYQPGVHATAGPLPPPPRASFAINPSSPPPPRPPRLHSPSPSKRDIELVKQTLQLPAAVSAALANKYQSSPAKSGQCSDLDSSLSGSSHRREGAFSPSSTSRDSNISDVGQEQAARMQSDPNDIETIVVQSPTTPAVPDQDANWPDGQIDSSPEGRTSVDGRTSGELSTGSHSPSIMSSIAPSPPPKSPKGFRNSLTKGLKRMSLHRSPSYKSLGPSSSNGHSESHRTPSPSSIPPPRPRPKIRSLYPAAMYCHEVYSIRNPQERCIIYAQKINELYSCDCGLADWLFEAQLRGPNGSRSTLKLNPNSTAPSSYQFTPQPRQTSRSSVISDATFPSRPDASLATDLGVKAEHLAPNVPPVLPYPALAVNTQRSHVAGTAPPRPSKAGSFFASLGRKASINRRDRQPGTVPTPQPARLTKNPPSATRPSPTVPGGPRAPSSRVSRSQTMMVSTPFSSSSRSSPEKLNRRPSLDDTPSTKVLDIHADPEFVRQVDKLADLLPNADRDILAGYLRRAGQDILAIGQYLEDEKNGTIIKPT